MTKLKKLQLWRFVESVGFSRIVVAAALVLLFIMTISLPVRLDASISDTLIQFGMNGVMVLALLPMIRSGCGLNFALPLGIIAGLLGAVTSVEISVTGLPGIILAMLIATPIAIILGCGHAFLLNRVKGKEMITSIYVGFASVAFMRIMWLVLPYKSQDMIWGYAGQGLRTIISIHKYWHNAIGGIGSLQIGDFFFFPTGMFLFFAMLCICMWLFLRSKTGTTMTAVGSNPEFAKANGININKMRTISVILSTWLGAIGIIIYQQGLGFIQLYMGPFYMAFPAAAAILIGGASIGKASIANVVIGTILFQSILTMTPSVISSLLDTDISEVLPTILSSSIILYALTRAAKAKS